MLKGYLHIILRNIAKHKLVSFITIFGLAVGLAGSMFIFLWVMDELNFDRFNKLFTAMRTDPARSLKYE